MPIAEDEPPTWRVALIRQRHARDGGAERFLEALAAVLGGRGLAVTVLARRWPKSEGLTVERCDPFHVGRWWRDAGFARAVERRLLRGDFDLVQSHERGCVGDVVRTGDGLHRDWLAARAEGRSRWLRWWDRVAPYHRWLMAAEERQLTHPGVEAIVCNTTLVRDRILETFRVAGNKLYVVPNAVDSEHFRPATPTSRAEARQLFGLAADQPVAAFVGSGFARKGVGFLLDLATSLPRMQLLVAGADKQRARYERLAAARELTSRVRFLGRVTDVRTVHAAADVFVLPTLYDPFPNAVLESMASGLPVVISSACGASDVVEDARSGYVLPRSDRVAWISRLRRLLEDPSLAREMGRCARARAETLTREAMADHWTAIYRAVLEKRVT